MVARHGGAARRPLELSTDWYMLATGRPRALAANLEQKGWAWPAALPKSSWGPRAWYWLHVTAINYPPSPTPVDARIAESRIWGFVTHLPCASCRDHATQFVRQRPPSLESTYALQAWVWRFHNAVNLRLGKPLIPYEEYLRLYADEICWADWTGECGAALL